MVLFRMDWQAKQVSSCKDWVHQCQDWNERFIFPHKSLSLHILIYKPSTGWISFNLRLHYKSTQAVLPWERELCVKSLAASLRCKSVNFNPIKLTWERPSKCSSSFNKVLLAGQTQLSRNVGFRIWTEAPIHAGDNGFYCKNVEAMACGTVVLECLMVWMSLSPIWQKKHLFSSVGSTWSWQTNPNKRVSSSRVTTCFHC